MAKRSSIGGITCFAAGCLMIVFAVMRQGRNTAEIGFGGVLIALGLFWLGPKRRRREKNPE